MAAIIELRGLFPISEALGGLDSRDIDNIKIGVAETALEEVLKSTSWDRRIIDRSVAAEGLAPLTLREYESASNALRAEGFRLDTFASHW